MPPFYSKEKLTQISSVTILVKQGPVFQDLTPGYQDSIPICQDSTPVSQDCTPVYQDLMPVCQDFVPASQDLPTVKDVCVTDSIYEAYKHFISEGLVSLLPDKVNSKEIEILRDKGASQSLLLADVLPFSEISYSGESALLKVLNVV